MWQLLYKQTEYLKPGNKCLGNGLAQPLVTHTVASRLLGNANYHLSSFYFTFRTLLQKKSKSSAGHDNQ
jgi:hypothetical protein